MKPSPQFNYHSFGIRAGMSQGLGPHPQFNYHSFEIRAGMSQDLDPPPSRHVSYAIEDYIQGKEAWNCWHTRLPWNPPRSSPTSWSTISNGSSVQNEDELCGRFNILSLTSASYDCLPETLGSFGQCPEGFGQDFAGSSATGVTRCQSPPMRDTGHATRSRVSASAKSFGEICEIGETVTAAAPEVQYLACPFSKHDPARYELVWNVCTNRPGWKGVKRVLEHIRKVHSRDKRCERCHTRYPKQNDLDIHMSKNNCAEVEETDPSRPELMTAEQEEIFDTAFDAMTPEDKWRAYYHFLFPDAPHRHSINPYYDYTTLTHRLDPFAAGLTKQKRPASPPLNPDDSPQSKRQSRGVPATTPQTDSFIAQSSETPLPYYGYRSGDREIPSVNQDTGVVEIGTSKCTDKASQSTNLDSAYGSRNGTIPSSSNPPAPMMSSSTPLKFDRDDSAIALSGNGSVLIGSTATQLESGPAVQDFGNPIPQPSFYPQSLDPDLPSSILTPDKEIDVDLNWEGLLNSNYHESLDEIDQKAE